MAIRISKHLGGDANLGGLLRWRPRQRLTE